MPLGTKNISRSFTRAGASAAENAAFEKVSQLVQEADSACNTGDHEKAMSILRALFVPHDTRADSERNVVSTSYLSSPHAILAANDAHRASCVAVEPAIEVAKALNEKGVDGADDMIARLYVLAATDLTDTWLSNKTRRPRTHDEILAEWGYIQDTERALTIAHKAPAINSYD